MKKEAPRFTIAKLNELKAAGKIRGFTLPDRKEEKIPVAVIGGRIVTKFYPTKSKEKNAILFSLLAFTTHNNLQLEEEYKFHELRKWRFDFAIRSLKIAIEYEGIFSEQSRHTNKIGYSKDSTKYREALKLGWKVLRYDAITYQNLKTDLLTLWQQKQFFPEI